MKKVMVRAWEIAREGVKKFGGKVKEFFQQALIMAWAEFKGVMKMVELKGSEKQVKWAEDIRANFLKALERYTSVSSEDEKVVKVVNAFKAFKEEIENQESAKWFIENRTFVNEKQIFEGEELKKVYVIDLDEFRKGRNISARERLAYVKALYN